MCLNPLSHKGFLCYLGLRCCQIALDVYLREWLDMFVLYFIILHSLIYLFDRLVLNSINLFINYIKYEEETV